MTALIMASSENELEVVEALLEAGADPLLEVEGGLTAEDIATEEVRC